jgi:hypothetical protein
MRLAERFILDSPFQRPTPEDHRDKSVGVKCAFHTDSSRQVRTELNNPTGYSERTDFTGAAMTSHYQAIVWIDHQEVLRYGGTTP